MDDKFRKSSTTSIETPSPVLLRRRLSAPETIMRKHTLAQQRSDSQDSCSEFAEVKSCQWRVEIEGSDPNLAKRKDSGILRKSSLMRRLWGNGKFSGSFCEWQHYSKLSSTHSLNSNHSSPEHKRSFDFNKISPRHSPKRKVSMFNCNNYSTETTTPKSTSSRTYDSAYSNTTNVKSDFSQSQDDDINKNSAKQNEATQTPDATNLNVISNVHLSQNTLDVIFKQVMQDVQSKTTESFYLKPPKEPQNKILKYMISNVGTGSSYSKPPEAPPVIPRFSALPRTSSMEVNISSGETSESDTISLVDSLEDTTEKTEPPLPDNSEKTNNNHHHHKPAAFFIPIDGNEEFKAVSDHLPDKVRRKLAKRQEKLHEKKSPVKEVDINLNMKKKKKPLLPSIETIRRIKIDKNKSSPKNVNKEKLSPLYTSSSIYTDGPRKIYHKTELNNTNRRIEILEIMECIDEKPKIKSRIPVSVQKLPKINPQKDKPTYLDFDNVPLSDPKLDQLIANILIETLNGPEMETVKNKNKKYEQKFEVIPEELSQQSLEDNQNKENNNEACSSSTTYKGKAAVAVVRDDNFSSIPKGWITFYMLHKNNQGSPDSTSDEGKKLDDKRTNKIDMTKESSGNLSSSSEKPRIKKFQKKQRVNKLGEWSVTVSGLNPQGQFGADLEMRLKFPNNNQCPSQSDSGLGEEDKRIQLEMKDTRRTEESEDSYYSHRLPDIRTKVRKQRKSESGIIVGPSRIIEPRPTKTSTRRSILNRPRIEYAEGSPRNNTLSLFEERHYAEILQRFPELLSITGNGLLSPNRKSRPSGHC